MTRFYNNPWENPNAREPLWPGGVQAQICRPCRRYAHDEGYCSVCGRETTKTLVFNTPEPEGANDTLMERRGRLQGEMVRLRNQLRSAQQTGTSGQP